jgi:phage terminase large subunit-like protein
MANLLSEWARRMDPEAIVEKASEVWKRQARPDQRLPDGNWRVVYFQGGRGSGKTRSGSAGLAELIENDLDFDPPGEYGIVAPTYRDAWTVCVEGEAGILRALGTTAGEVKHGQSKTVEYAYRSYGEIGLRSGHVIYVDSADDGALRVQGKNLRALWGDEIGLWKRWQVAWEESVRFAVRKGVSKIIVTGTPKASRPARRLVRRLIRAGRGDDEFGDGPVIVRRLRTIDNILNLSESFFRSVVGAAKGTRLERQELEGELLDDVANALWTREMLEKAQCPAVGEQGGPEYLTSIKMGVDPSDGTEESDEQAYTIVGLGPMRDQVYVVESWGGQEAPAPFARRFLIRAAQLDATVIVEKNHGGEWMMQLIEQVQRALVKEGVIKKRVRVEKIHASESKRTRAEPISGLYEREIVRHCQKVTKFQMADPDTGEMKWRTETERFTELEDQQATFTGAHGERSPDRLDSLVWACTPFLPLSFGPAQHARVVKWAREGGQLANAVPLERERGGDPIAAPDPDSDGVAAPRAVRRLQLQQVAALGGFEDLDGWGPQDPDDAPEHGTRGNVRSWSNGSSPF